MSSQKGSVIVDSMTYTQGSLAELLGRTPDWIVENVIDQGCYAKRIGNLYFVTGQSFRIWIENTAEMATNADRRSSSRKRKNDDSDLGGET